MCRFEMRKYVGRKNMKAVKIVHTCTGAQNFNDVNIEKNWAL